MKGLSGLLNQSSTRLSDGCGDLRVRRDAADSVASSLSSRLNGPWLRARLVAERKNQLANDPQLRGGRAHLLAQLANGFITGVRFSKGVNNTGTHVGNLWSSSGTLLASATFTGESGSGWQQVNFSSPVAITANTVYVASYFSPTGDFSVDRNYFNAVVNNPPLQALQNGGVYNCGSSSGFPAGSFQASNYWVDVVFSQ